jgi:hypothetical protein
MLDAYEWNDKIGCGFMNIIFLVLFVRTFKKTPLVANLNSKFVIMVYHIKKNACVHKKV